jgi:hypothetical protein
MVFKKLNPPCTYLEISLCISKLITIQTYIKSWQCRSYLRNSNGRPAVITDGRKLKIINGNVQCHDYQSKLHEGL